jgi:hypothetical protein
MPPRGFSPPGGSIPPMAAVYAAVGRGPRRKRPLPQVWLPTAIPWLWSELKKRQDECFVAL